MVLRYFILLLSGLFFVACSSEQKEVVNDVQFVLKKDSKSLSCEDLSGVGLTDFRFYLFQDEGEVQLLDFVSAGECRTNLKVADFQFLVEMHDSLSFNIGVPNHLNHQNPVKAKPPLNQSAMHWQWLSGYKFLRLEYDKDEQFNRFHLGSWGCSGKIPNDVKCQLPNLIKISLDDFNVQKSVVEVHLDALTNVESDSLCMGDPNEPTCQKWSDALQNDVFKTGTNLQ